MSDLTQLCVQKPEKELVKILQKQICKGEISESEIADVPNKLNMASKSLLSRIIGITENQLKDAKQEYKIKEKGDFSNEDLSRIEKKGEKYEEDLKSYKKQKKNVEERIPKVKKVCEDLQPFINSFKEYCSIRKYYYEDLAEILVQKTIKKIKDITKMDIEEKIESYVPLDILSKLDKINNDGQDVLLKRYGQELSKKTSPEFLERLKSAGMYGNSIASTIKEYDGNTAEIIKKIIYDMAEKQASSSDMAEKQVTMSDQNIFDLYIKPEFLRNAQKEFKEDYTQEKVRIEGGISGKKQYLESQTEKLNEAAENSIRAGKEEHASGIKNQLEKIKDDTEKEIEERKEEMEEKTKQHEILSRGIDRLLLEFDNISNYNTINNTYNENIGRLERVKNSFDSEFKNLIDSTRGKLKFNEFFKSIDSIIDEIGPGRMTYKI